MPCLHLAVDTLSLMSASAEPGYFDFVLLPEVNDKEALKNLALRFQRNVIYVRCFYPRLALAMLSSQ